MKPIEIKMKPIDVTSDSYSKPKFKVGDHVRIWKHKIIFAKGYTQNCSVEVFVFSKIKSTVPRTYVISTLNGEPTTGSFYEKELQKLLKRKSDKSYVKWKGYDNSFNSWIDKKDII